MCELAAAGIGAEASQVLVCSTGLIGIPLPRAPLEQSVPQLVHQLGTSQEAGRQAALAIMTTDTQPKQTWVEGPGFAVGGMAKGAAMLAPNMATMLAVLATNAVTDPTSLQKALRGAVAQSFNRLTVDGCTSTNDTVLVLASGEGGPASLNDLEGALFEACADLAWQMAQDAEGATKVVEVTVVGASTDAQALRAARQVADSALVKCSFHGGDPYWGRILSELATAGVTFNPQSVAISYGGTWVCRSGVASEHDEKAVARHMAGPHLQVVADLGLNSGQATITTTDLSPGYIDENMRTS